MLMKQILLSPKRDLKKPIAPFLAEQDEYELTRPKEGDLIFFPLGKRLFEIKFVEHEKPFYQLNQTYVYQLNCELFEYEDEVIDTDVSAIDQVVQTEGYFARLILSQVGSDATVNPRGRHWSCIWCSQPDLRGR